MRILVGGVGQLYQGDLDLGRRAAARLAGEELGKDVVVEDLSYGAVAVAQRLEELAPELLIVVGAEARGRGPGTVERRLLVTGPSTETHRAVAEAVTGYVGIDLLAEVCGGLGVLPRRSIAVEVEPARTEPSDALSQAARSGFERALELVRAEVRRAPLLEIAERLRARTGDGRLEPSSAVETLRSLLEQLEGLEREGSWGSAFAVRDELRSRISEGRTGEGMDHLDWSLWWALIEELDRLQRLDL